jgi:hypothetical protein
LILEEGGCKHDAIIVRYRGEITELLHLEDPGFQGFGSSACERWGTIWFGTRGWGRLYHWVGNGCCLGNSTDLAILLRNGLVLLGDGVILSDDGLLHLL